MNNSTAQSQHQRSAAPEPQLGDVDLTETKVTATPVVITSSGQLPAVKLLKNRKRGGGAPREWPVEIPAKGTWRVTGPAGSGVSSFLVDTVVEKIAGGGDPSGVLVVTASKESGALIRQELNQRLGDFVASSTLVRSVHSLAFALLRLDAGAGQSTPDGMLKDLRLITGAEQDAVIRDLLEGHRESGGRKWPEYIRPALSMVGFARQLRDFLLRAAERGLGPDELIDLGQRFNQPMWESSGEFLREYEQVMALSGHRSLNAAELVGQVALRPELTHNHAWHTVVVDDAQLLDPNAGQLICALAPDAELVVVGGNPQEAVFAFRGASEEFLENLPQLLPQVQTIELSHTHRKPQPACVALVESAGAQRDVVADMVRRRHLDDGVAWSDIAVIVRGGGEIGQFRRALLTAGVPVHINPTDVILAEQRLVAALLQALVALTQPMNNSELEELIVGPIGGADPVTMRRLIRGLRRFRPGSRGIDTLRELLEVELPDFKGLLTSREEDILIRLRGVLDAGRAALGGSIEEVLWAVWNATGLSGRLQKAALAGGATGSQADRDLDAVMALFDLAGDYSERYPEANLDSFLNHVLEQELPTGVRDRRSASPDAVEILSAHGAVGREWDTVIVVGAQEGSWPSLGETGSIFGQEALLDLLDDGIAPGGHVSHVPERLIQERRLFYVATTRHRSRLAVVAVDAPDADTALEPSRFISEFFGSASTSLKATSPGIIDAATLEAGDPLDRAAINVLSVPSFVAQLRRAVTEPTTDDVTRAQAARQLARLARAGVPGAHPDSWWGLTQAVSAESVEVAGEITISPSKVEALLKCPMGAVLGQLETNAQDNINLIRGSMAHAFLEALGRGVEPEQAHSLVVQAYGEVLEVPVWKRDYEMEQFSTLLQRTQAWEQSSRASRELAGVEVPVRTTVASGVTISGYIDRLEKSDDGYFIVDLKTSTTAARSAEVQANPQLGAYQLALANGQLKPDRIVDGPGMDVAGAALVYPAAKQATVAERIQSSWPPQELEDFAAKLPQLVKQMRGPELIAIANENCSRCLVRTLCPIQPEGKMITSV